MLSLRSLFASRVALRPTVCLPLFALLAGLVFAPDPARPCTGVDTSRPPLLPGNPFPGVPAPAAGRFQTIFRVPVSLFAPSVPTRCACGLGLGQSGMLPPAGLTVDRVFVIRLNPVTGQQAILGEFAPLNRSTLTSDGLAIGPGQIFPGAKWFGFNGLVQPFTVPVLNAGEIFAMAFVVSYPAGQQNQLVNLKTQFAGGEAELDGFPSFTGIHRVTYFGAGQVGKCLPTQNALCLQNNRFRFDLKFREEAGGVVRPAKVTAIQTGRTGGFFFSDPNTVDAVVKVINSCSNNDRYWVFASAATNVEFTLTVTDTQANRTKRYTNPLGRPAQAVTDTSAFATCP